MEHSEEEISKFRKYMQHITDEDILVCLFIYLF